ncbi:MAG: hypothetical protein F9K41_19430, partial [Sphingopyxis terrae]
MGERPRAADRQAYPRHRRSRHGRQPWLRDWLLHDVVWEIVVGIGGGWLIGWLFGWLTYRTGAETKLSQTGDGLIALAATFLSYGTIEVLNAYGFLSVFVTALTLRRAHRNHSFNEEMHDFTEQIERLGMMVLLILFGGALVSGLLQPLTWTDFAAALAIIFLVRPAAGL